MTRHIGHRSAGENGHHENSQIPESVHAIFSDYDEIPRKLCGIMTMMWAIHLRAVAARCLLAGNFTKFR